MQKLFLIISFISITFLSCTKKAGDEPTGPDATYITEGFLCTIGTGRDYRIDTLVFLPTLGIAQFREYAKGFQKALDEVYFTTNSNNTVSVKLKIPLTYINKTYTHIGLYGSNLPVGSENWYPFSLNTEASTETEFILRRKDGDKSKFTLESKAAPGYYMSAVYPGQQYSPNSTVESKLIYSFEKQEFFFLPD